VAVAADCDVNRAINFYLKEEGVDQGGGESFGDVD